MPDTISLAKNREQLVQEGLARWEHDLGGIGRHHTQRLVDFYRLNLDAIGFTGATFGVLKRQFLAQTFRVESPLVIPYALQCVENIESSA